jgi:predicted negative regulator of RcsB-dependent stress response
MSETEVTKNAADGHSSHHHGHKKVTFEAKAAQFITQSAKPFLVTAAVALVAAGAYLGYGQYLSSLEAKSQEELFTLQKSVEDKEKKLEGDPKAKAAPSQTEKTPQNLTVTFGDDLKNYEAFIKNHANKKAAYMAAIQSARLATDYHDYAKAEAILRGVVASPEASDLFSGLLRAQLSAVLIEQKKCAEAIKELSMITENKAQSYFHPQALLRIGACAIEGKEWDKAQSALTRVEKDFANTQAASEAKQLKRLLLLKRGEAGGAAS